MADDVKKIIPDEGIPPATAYFVQIYDAAIREAIQDAVYARVPQGYIVALLQGHLQYQTQRMIDAT